MAPSRLPYHGSGRKLVLAMDIGTTFSGISYALLDPGEIPMIKGVTRFPAQENVGGDSKIPSIIYYDRLGNVQAVGAEALQESIVEAAEDNGWIKLEWWKLHLRPKRLASSHINDSDLPKLPPNKTAVGVLGDFMKYLLRCAQIYISETHSESLWTSVADNIDFVLTHPNGWEGPQQSEIRRAAVIGGLVSGGPGAQSRIQLLTEGEASLHFCIENGLLSDATTDGKGIIIVDGGGGTIDLSAYSMVKPPASFGEIAPTECRLQGSVFVDRRAHKYLQAKLANSKFGTAEDIKNMADCFGKSTKLKFRNPEEPSYIKFGGVRDTDLAAGIRSGQLKLPGSDIAALFEPSIESIIQAIEEQRRTARMTITSIFLVGGFSASEYLFHRLQELMSCKGITLLRPDSHQNKAVADGALSFYLDHSVSTRVANKTFGVDCMEEFDPYDQEHISRSSTKIMHPSGHEYIPDIFDVILSKGTCVQEETEFRSDFQRTSFRKADLTSVQAFIRCYHGKLQHPRWTDIEIDQFSSLCAVEADTSQLAKTLQLCRGRGVPFYQMKFSIVLLFGLTELKAQICWVEKGVEKRGPARVVYDIEETIADV